MLSELVGQTILHSEIREKGGAYLSKTMTIYISTSISTSAAYHSCLFLLDCDRYAGGSNVTHDVVEFYSYRDPNALPTVEAFARTREWLLAGEFQEKVQSVHSVCGCGCEYVNPS